jgi:hypothetical protein
LNTLNIQTIARFLFRKKHRATELVAQIHIGDQSHFSCPPFVSNIALLAQKGAIEQVGFK